MTSIPPSNKTPVVVVRADVLLPAQKAAIMHLWNEEYPAQLTFATPADFEHYLRALSKPRHYMALAPDGSINGWAFAFDREGERWFAIIVDHIHHKQGIGTVLVHALKKDNPILNGWVTDHDRYRKKNGDPYLSPKGFYSNAGFSFCHDERLETEKLSAVKITWRSI